MLWTVIHWLAQFSALSSLEEYLTRLLKNHVAKFTRLLAEKGLGQSWKMPLAQNIPTGEFFVLLKYLIHPLCCDLT